MHLLKSATGVFPDDAIPVTLIVSHAVYAEPDEDGTQPVIEPVATLAGNWALSDEGGPDAVATIKAGRVVETSDPDILGCWLSPTLAGWPAEPLNMVEVEIEQAAVPAPLTARRLRLGLVAHGISTAQVADAIAAIPDPALREVAEIEWEYATEFDRDHPLIEQVGGALGLTSLQIDAMWEASAAL